MDHCRLIYRSTAAEEGTSNSAIRELVATAESNNKTQGITGLLILSGNHFLQVLEGPGEEVNALFQKICHDPRHHTIELIEFKQTPNSYFDDWHMRLVDLYDLPREKRNLLMDKYDYADDVVVIPDKVPMVFSLLLDARSLCLGTPWEE